MVTILSIDGGGIRGIIPATFLMEFEKRTGEPVCELFDLVAGTSTGGILAAMLTVPNGHGKPRYSAEEVRSAYLENGRTIFQKNLLNSVKTLGGLGGPKYSPSGLDTMLEKYLGNYRLHTTLTEILIPAYDMMSSCPWFFKTSFALHHRAPEDDPLLSQVVRATTAAPTYFPPLTMEEHCMIDGGVFACNPALCAYTQAKNMYPDEYDFLIVSLGTGLHLHHWTCSEISGWGIANWAVPIGSVILNSSSETVNYQLRALTGSENYMRLQVHLDKHSTRMDDASETNMRRLVTVAQQAVIQESVKIDQLCRILKKNAAKKNDFDKGTLYGTLKKA